ADLAEPTGDEADVGVLCTPGQHLVADYQQTGDWVVIGPALVGHGVASLTGSRAEAGSAACRPVASDSRRAFAAAPRPAPGSHAVSPPPSSGGRDIAASTGGSARTRARRRRTARGTRRRHRSQVPLAVRGSARLPVSLQGRPF